jgi:hypothetical protein
VFTDGTPDALSVMSARFGIGTLTPAYDIDIVTDASLTGMQATSYNTAPNNRAIVSLRSARGSLATPADVVAGDWVGEVVGAGYSGAATTGGFRTTWSMRGVVDAGTVSETSLPTALVFMTTPDGSVTRAEAMRIDANKRLYVGGTTSGWQLGAYVAGSSAATGHVVITINGTTYNLLAYT